MVKFKPLDIACILYIVINVILVFMGLMYLFLGTFMSYHVDFTGLTEQDVTTFNAELMTLISILIRLVGVGNFNGGVASIIVTIFALRKGEKWAWAAGIISGAIIVIPNVILTYTVLATNFMYIIIIICMILWIAGVALSTYDIFYAEKE